MGRSRASHCRRPPRGIEPRLRLLGGALALILAWPHGAQAEEAGHGANVITGDALAVIAAAGGMTLHLETSVNGAAAGLATFAMHEQELWASRATLEQLGLVPGAGAPEAMRLSDLPRLGHHYDAARQSLSLTAPLELLGRSTSVIARPEPAAQRSARGSGLVYNYNLFAGFAGSEHNVSAFSELRGFSPMGVASSTFLTRIARTDGGLTSHNVRLDTTATASFPRDLVSVRIGDGVTAGAPWSRQTRFGGVQIGTNFALQPYHVITPLTHFFGEAALPSTVELHVDGLKQATGEVPPGPFQISAPAGASVGAGSGQVVITDALGQVRTISLDLYHAETLLRRGLSDWTVETGFVRRAYGISSFDYAPAPFAAGTLRHGVSDRLTVETHAQAARGLVQIGMGADWLAGQLGVVTASLAQSAGGGHSGRHVAFGYRWSNRHTAISFNAARSNRFYRDLPSLEGAPPPRLALSAHASRATRTLGSFGLGFTDLHFRGQERSRFVTAHWSRSVSANASIAVNAAADLEDKHHRSIFATLSIRFGDRISVHASAHRDTRTNFGSVEATRSIPEAGGIGWRARLQQAGSDTSGAGELQYLGDHGQALFGSHVVGGQVNAFAGVSGALVLMDGSLFAARQVHDAFAVVSSGGIAGVPVRLRNSIVGETGRNGKLLVTGLNAYEDNAIGIDTMSLPADVRVGAVETAVTPGDRSGTLVKFELAKVRAAILVLTDGEGRSLPVGSTVRLGGSAEDAAIVGFDGEVYLESLKASNRIDVETPDGRCTVRFTYPEQAGALPRIAPLICTAKAET